jgi:hypothetical protein
VPAAQHGNLTKGGRFRLREEFDPASRRTLRVARLVAVSGLNGDRTKNSLLPLWDAAVIFSDGGYWTVIGFEREVIKNEKVSLRQTWALRELPAEVCEEIESTIAMGREAARPRGREASIPTTMKWASALPPPPPAPVDLRKTVCSTDTMYGP